MTTPTTPAAEVAQHRDIVLRLNDEADLCRNDGANDIAALLDDAVKHIQARALEFLSAEAQADERESALVAERDALRAACVQLLEAAERIEKRIAYYASVAEADQPNIKQWAYTDNSGDVAALRVSIVEARGAINV